MKSILDTATAQSRSETGGTRKADVFLCGLILVMNRLAAPWQLIRTRHPRGRERRDRPHRRDALCRGGHHRARRNRKHGRRVARRTQSRAADRVDAQSPSRCGARAALGNGYVGQLALEPPTGGDPRRSLRLCSRPRSRRRRAASGACCGRARPKKSCRARCSTPSTSTEAEMRGRICRRLPALRQRTCRQRSDDARSFGTARFISKPAPSVLLDSLRHAGDADRPFRQSQVDAAIRFCRTYSAPNMQACLPRPPRSRCIPRRPSARRCGRELRRRPRKLATASAGVQCAIAAPRFPLQPHSPP